MWEVKLPIMSWSEQQWACEEETKLAEENLVYRVTFDIQHAHGIFIQRRQSWAKIFLRCFHDTSKIRWFRMIIRETRMYGWDVSNG